MAPTKNEVKNKGKQRYVYTTSQLYSKIKNVLQNVPAKIYDSNREQAFRADETDVAQFLYKIGFINGRKDYEDRIERAYFDEYPHLLEKRSSDGGFSWEIHPAYRAVLSANTRESWTITLTDDLTTEDAKNE